MKPTIWLAVVDSRRARLLSATLTPRGTPRIEDRASVEEQWEEKEHGRPSRRTGKTEESYASRHREDEERARRYAKSVTAWLGEQIASRSIDQLPLFAPQRVLGALRAAFPVTLRDRIAEHHGDYGHLSTSELAGHRVIVDVITSSLG